MTRTPVLSRWSVPLAADPNQCVAVELRRSGAYTCTCGQTRECTHIQAVRSGLYAAEGEQIGPQYELKTSNVREVELEEDILGNRTRVLVPILPLGNAHAVATIVYDLLRLGVRWSALRNWVDLLANEQGGSVSQTEVEALVRRRGRLIYGTWQEGWGWGPMVVVPVDGPDAAGSGETSAP